MYSLRARSGDNHGRGRSGSVFGWGCGVSIATGTFSDRATDNAENEQNIRGGLDSMGFLENIAEIEHRWWEKTNAGK